MKVPREIAREPVIIMLSLYRNGTMNAEINDWRPIAVHILLGP